MRHGIPRPKTVVVVSPDPLRRWDWARHFEGDGTRVLRCAGPSVACALLEGLPTCPLLDEADVAVYDREALVRDFVPTLLAKHPALPVLFARDEATLSGHHVPVVLAASGPIEEARQRAAERIIPPPPRAISEEEAELEIRELEHRS